jgi:chromate transporter
MLNADADLKLTPATLGAIFGVCLKIGVLSFGGGLSGWLHQEFVERNKWISEDDFASSLALSQMLPGANVVNLVVCMGEQLRGPKGAVVGAFGFLLGPFFAVIGLSAVVDHLQGLLALDAILAGVAASATGLLLVICLKGVRRAARHRSGLLIIAGTVIGVAALKLPLLVVVAIIAPVSIALRWKRNGFDA